MPAIVPDEPPVELGVLRGAYGLKGWVRVVPHAADAVVLRAARTWWLTAADGSRQCVQLAAARSQGAGLVAKIDGVETPEAAEALRGRRVGVPRSQFPPVPEGEFYWVDLLGLQVINRQGLDLGHVGGLRSNGVQDLLEVGTLLIPMIPQYVDRIDLPGRRIEVDWQAEW